MDFPDPCTFPAFDGENPVDVTAEAGRVAVLQSLVDPMRATTSDEAAQACVTGALVGVVHAALLIMPPEHHRHMIQNLSNALPWAASYARDLMNLPPLKDS
ncbi:hypothetical protein SAMN05444339_11021 [Loktanella atrilutea]|uniref:Uncharacterized protein n=2 Tax=Loktanella atrilutea TaxID=366533 RepID=A0A1M5DK65_LOKAT|nr:hypothetical protein SAMN05444339_11021 [Loktanella atrilutea]